MIILLVTLIACRGWISHDAKIEVDPDINSSDGTQDITIDSLSYKFKVNVSTTSMDSYCYGFDKNTWNHH